MEWEELCVLCGIAAREGPCKLVPDTKLAKSAVVLSTELCGSGLVDMSMEDIVPILIDALQKPIRDLHHNCNSLMDISYSGTC